MLDCSPWCKIASLSVLLCCCLGLPGFLVGAPNKDNCQREAVTFLCPSYALRVAETHLPATGDAGLLGYWAAQLAQTTQACPLPVVSSSA